VEVERFYRMEYDYQKTATEREKECRERAIYFEERLRFFSRTNWISVLIPSLLGVVAGSALFSNGNSFWLGIGALVAALLSAIHKGLDCDAHQVECRRLVQEYRGLEIRYRTVHQIKSSTPADDLRALDEELANLRKSQTATTDPQWLKNRIRT
jgi:hypothetical protein